MTRRKHVGLSMGAFRLLSGSAAATAFGIRLGWKFAVITEVVVLVAVGIVYLTGKEDTDAGAILGNRADERQSLVMLRASRLAHIVALVATIVAFVIAVAVRAAYWPFLVLYGVLVVAYLVGLHVYGAHDVAAAANAEQEDASVSS
jgi:hypothetical protein